MCGQLGLTPLSMAAAIGHVEGTRKLLEAGAAVEDKSSVRPTTSLCLFVCLPACLSVCSPACLFVSVCLPVCVSLPACLPAYLSV